MNPEIQKILQPLPQPSQSTKAVRKFVIFILIIIAVVTVIFLLAEYDRWQNMRAVDQLNQMILDIQKADYEEAMKDTYGGKTPQETLSLYISAIEKGDYELASKYFIGTRQQKELEKLKKSEKQEVNIYISEIKKILNGDGVYSQENQRFSFNGDILLNLKQYPNGIWKIIEI
jgi:PhoPQ-activated pathogenicity-related protein